VVRDGRVQRVTETFEPDAALNEAMSDLAHAVPALRPILDEHVDYNGEVLASVVLADFRNALVEFVESGDDVAITAFLDEIERLAASTSRDVRNVVAVVILEDGVMHSGGNELAALTAIVPRFGPATQALLEKTREDYAKLVESSRRHRSSGP
jgi:hypothetical protein